MTDSEFSCIFSDTHTRSNLVEHNIDVWDADPIHQRFYRASSEILLNLDDILVYADTGGHALFFTRVVLEVCVSST